MSALPTNLISEFVKITNDNRTTTRSSSDMVFGVVVEDSGNKYVKMDGSEILTPVQTTAVVKHGDRVIVTIKNHTAIVTGNLTGQSIRNMDFEELIKQVNDFKLILADTVKTEELEAVYAEIDKVTTGFLTADQVKAESVSAVVAALKKVTADSLKTDELYAAVAHIFNLAADNIEADEITTDELAASLATINRTSINRASINYAQIVDAYTNRLFTDSATAGKVRAENLEISQAQIVDLIVSSFRLVDQDGKVYKVSIDKEGNLITEYLYDQDEWMENGEIPDGYSAVADNFTVGDVTAGNLYVTGAADIMKLTAKWLSADQAWINELTTGLIKSELGTGLNLQSNTSIKSIVSDTEETQRGLNEVASRFEQTTESFEFQLTQKVGQEDLRHYLRYDDGTVEMGSSESRYKLKTNDSGVYILQDNEVMTRMEKNTVSAPVFEVRRMLKMGEHIAKVSASGALVFN